MAKWIIFSMFAICLSGCRAMALIPIPTLSPTSTTTPSQTPEPTRTSPPTLTPTLAPTSTQKPTQAPSQEASNTTEPLKEYKGIPIMPGAISGNEDEKGYTFIITSTPKDIKTYYVEKFQELGYMCVLNMFKEDDKFSGLMCFSPTLTLLAETQGDGNVKVTISFFTP